MFERLPSETKNRYETVFYKKAELGSLSYKLNELFEACEDVFNTLSFNYLIYFNTRLCFLKETVSATTAPLYMVKFESRQDFNANVLNGDNSSPKTNGDRNNWIRNVLVFYEIFSCQYFMYTNESAFNDIIDTVQADKMVRFQLKYNRTKLACSLFYFINTFRERYCRHDKKFKLHPRNANNQQQHRHEAPARIDFYFSLDDESIHINLYGEKRMIKREIVEFICSKDVVSLTRNHIPTVSIS